MDSLAEIAAGLSAFRLAWFIKLTGVFIRGTKGNTNGANVGVVVRIIVWEVLNLHDRGLHVKIKSRISKF